MNISSRESHISAYVSVCRCFSHRQRSRPLPVVSGLCSCPIERFDDSDKAVPHMGWNSAQLLDSEVNATDGMDPAGHYYFVHSYRAKYDPEKHPNAAQWAHTTTQYGQEVFMATVRRGNVFGTQFHPEKSGEAGLKLLDFWLSQPESERTSAPPTPRIACQPKPKDGLTKRIIACMDVRANDEGDLVVTKGDQYDVREKATLQPPPQPKQPAVQSATSVNPSPRRAVLRIRGGRAMPA